MHVGLTRGEARNFSALTSLRFTGANRTPNSIELETKQRAVRVRCNR